MIRTTLALLLAAAPPAAAYSLSAPSRADCIHMVATPASLSAAELRAAPAPACVPGEENILLRAAMGEATTRPPVWLMRQAGRYMGAFREYSTKYEVCASPAGCRTCRPCGCHPRSEGSCAVSSPFPSSSLTLRPFAIATVSPALRDPRHRYRALAAAVESVRRGRRDYVLRHPHAAPCDGYRVRRRPGHRPHHPVAAALDG